MPPCCAAAAYFRFFFVFGEGVKSGELNYVVYKGVLFKTYEGKLIQTGIRSKAAGSIQSYEFEFSVENEALARELMLQGGKTLELHYKEYFGAPLLAGLRCSSSTALSSGLRSRENRASTDKAARFAQTKKRCRQRPCNVFFESVPGFLNSLTLPRFNSGSRNEMTAAASQKIATGPKS